MNTTKNTQNSSNVFSGKVLTTLEFIIVLKLILNSLSAEGKILSEKIKISFLVFCLFLEIY